jgi:predicted flap endonuclease-1-like 5' DNA nuclease
MVRSSTSEILDIVGGAEALQGSLDKLANDILAAHQQRTLAESAAVRRNGAARQPVLAAAAAPAPVAVAEAVAEAEPPAGPAPIATGGKRDDLALLEGIGPKIAGVLRAAGIDTFARLGETSEAELRSVLEAAGLRLAPSLPTWPQQAELAARGDWGALKALQDQLKGGRAE